MYIETSTCSCFPYTCTCICNECMYIFIAFRTLPLLVWHRQNWNVVYPNVDLNELELSDLVTHSTYIAGFTDAAVEGRSDLYDLFINGKV